MNKTFVTIVALSIDTNFAVLYKPDGDTITIRQGDPRLPGIVETAREPLARGEPVEVDISIIYAKQEAYEDTEKGTNGLVKFFRVAKKFVQDMINTESPVKVAPDVEHITPVMLGLVPGSETATAIVEPEPETPTLYKLIVSAYGPEFNKVSTIKALRTIANLGLKEAKDLAESPLPYLVIDGLTEELRGWATVEMGKAIGVSFLTVDQNVEIPLGNGESVSFDSLMEPKKEDAPAPVAPLVPERDPTMDGMATPKGPEPTNAEKVANANAKMDALLGAGAQSTDNPEFHKPLDEKTETIVAVNTKTGAVIPDAQKLVPHMKSASKLEDYVGFTKFFERLSAIVDQRGHSVEDLMKFMFQGDLPIADDGCIVAYKRLQPGDKGVMVDCHSKKVKQKVGSFVFMRHGLVDPNRRQDCSNGLHIAALSYLSGFSGNATVVVKINPEDVFAVPEYSHNKMRVAGYHIVALLPEKLRTLVNSGGSISSVPEGATLLNNILRGNHIGITQTVEIGGQYGANLTIKEVAGSDHDAKQVFQKTEAKNSTVEVGAETSTEVEQPVAAPVVAADIKPTSEPKEEMSQKDHVRQQFALLGTSDKDTAHKIAVDLMALKTRTGKSWFSLGLTDVQASTLRNYVKTAADTQAPAPAKPAKAGKAKAKAPAKAKADKPKSAAKAGSPRATIRDLIGKGIAANVAAILAAKKQAKKGWAALGVSEAEQAEIEKNSK